LVTALSIVSNLKSNVYLQEGPADTTAGPCFFEVSTMRFLLFTWLLFTASSLLHAAEKQASFVFMPAYWYGYHWEQTPDALGKSSKRQLLVTAAWRLPFGLALGGSWLKNSSYAQDSRVQLSGQGLSLGYVGAGHLSAFYTFLYKPRLDYDFPSLDARTSYYGGSGSILDIGLHFGTSWLRFGPRIVLIDVNYKESSISSGTDTESVKLQGQPWKDRWLEPYVGLWFLF
jgi:hypothetical protein